MKKALTALVLALSLSLAHAAEAKFEWNGEPIATVEAEKALQELVAYMRAHPPTKAKRK